MFFFSFLRLTVKELLESEFFRTEKLRVELAKPLADIIEQDLQVIPLRLEGERAKHGQDEAIEFDYTIGEDEPELIAAEMVPLFQYQHHLDFQNSNCFYFPGQQPLTKSFH